MQAANEGAAGGDPAREGGSIGIRVELPFEQGTNPWVSRDFEHRTFFTRLHHFALVSDAFVVVPGGIGTALEALMVWQLLQVGHLRDCPAGPRGEDVGGPGALGGDLDAPGGCPAREPEGHEDPRVHGERGGGHRLPPERHAAWKGLQAG